MSGPAFDKLAQQLLAFTAAIGDQLELELPTATATDPAWLRAYALFSRQVLALHAERRAQHAATRWMIVDDSGAVDQLEEQRRRLKP